MKKKLLLTGTAGFIGSNLVRSIIYNKLPYEIYSIDKIANSSLINNIYQNKLHEFFIADICDRHIMEKIFEYVKPDAVMHLAAESAVDKSIEGAEVFVKSNVLGTQVLVDMSIKYGVEKFMQISCYDSQTKAMTRDGSKLFDELKVGDMVLSINPETNLPEEKRINKIIVQDYSGDMIRFSNRRVDLLTTPNHRFLVNRHYRNNYNNKLEWTTAEEIEKNSKQKHNYYLPISHPNKESVKTINLPEIGEVDAAALFYVCGVFIGDGFTAYQERKVANISGYSKKELSSKIKDPKTGRFFKSNLIERGPRETSTCICYRIFFDVPVDDKARKPLEEALKKLNIEFSAHSGKAGEYICFSSKEWLKFFDSFGKGAENKKIPDWMLDHGTDLLKQLWQGCHDSNGYGYGLNKGSPEITTISTKLKDQLCYLGNMIGYNTRVYNKYSCSYFEGRKIEGDSFVIYFANKKLPLLSGISREKYSGKIWCLSVEDNKNFLVERNGKVAFSGNTDEVLGSLGPSDPLWTEESPMNPLNPYSASKAAAELVVKAAHNTFKLPYLITRSCNNLGPRQTSDKLVPRVIKCILNKQPIPVYGKGEQMRDWIHVYDNCSALMTVLDKGQNNSIYNVSANQEFKNIDMIHLVCDIMGYGRELITYVPDRLGHDFRYGIDSSKLKNLGWSPVYKLKDAVANTVAWYLDNQWFLKCQ